MPPQPSIIPQTVRLRIRTFQADCRVEAGKDGNSAKLVCWRARWNTIHATATTRPPAPSTTNMDRQPSRSIIKVRIGGAIARPIVCDELITAVARARVEGLNHSRVLRIPEG